MHIRGVHSHTLDIGLHDSQMVSRTPEAVETEFVFVDDQTLITIHVNAHKTLVYQWRKGPIVTFIFEPFDYSKLLIHNS